MTLDLTIDEAQTLLSLIDAAVRANGLQAATVALPLVQKLQQAAAQKQESQE